MCVRFVYICVSVAAVCTVRLALVKELVRSCLAFFRRVGTKTCGQHLCLKVEPFAVTQKPHVILHGWLDVRKSAVCPGAKVYCTPSVVMVKRMLSTVNFHQFVLFFAGMVEEVPNAEEYLTQALASLP